MPRNFIVVQFISSVRYVPVIMEEEEQCKLVQMSHWNIVSSVEDKEISGHFGRENMLSTGI